MRKYIDLALAWRDEDYYLSLTEEERASLGAHPTGAMTDDILALITGGCGPYAGAKTLAVTVCYMMNEEAVYCN